MRNALILAAILGVVGCAKAGAQPASMTARDAAAKAPDGDGVPVASGPVQATEPADRKRDGSWVGAASASGILSSDTRETFLGVWVDVPEARPEARPPMQVALVIDTSGSMAGDKIQNARAAAAMMVRRLKDGDIVSLDSFSDHARTVVPPTRLDSVTRTDILRQIAVLPIGGSTNMFEGLSLGESQMAAAPASHSLRRIVLISDGRANVGPSSPEILGSIAERGLRFRAQVTSLGVGNDYDETTLDALAVRSSGRLFHIGDSREMVSIMNGELDRLDATAASDAQLEIVPAPGVAVLGADTVRTEWRDGTLRIPLGALHAGQHREALVRISITDRATFEGQTRPLASVRLRFKDSADGDLERIHEAVARASMSDDAGAVARSANARTQAIAAITSAARTQLTAAQHINDGSFVDADKELAKAEATLVAQARIVTSAPEKKRLEAAAGRVATARAATKAMPSAAPAARREGALKLNADAMHDSGF
jgi:Ca-activated chloride channel homolog